MCIRLYTYSSCILKFLIAQILVIYNFPCPALSHSFFIYKGVSSLFIYKGFSSLFIYKGFSSLFIYKGFSSLFIYKGFSSLCWYYSVFQLPTGHCAGDDYLDERVDSYGACVCRMTPSAVNAQGNCDDANNSQVQIPEKGLR